MNFFIAKKLRIIITKIGKISFYALERCVISKSKKYIKIMRTKIIRPAQ